MSIIGTRLIGAKLPFVSLAAALMLSACVETGSMFKTADAEAPAAAVPAVITPPELLEAQAMYAARKDGEFNLPTIPAEKVPASHRRQVVDYATDQVPGTIIIDPTPKFLYYVLGNGKAIRYGISVGKDGFQWSGESIVANKRHWPRWTPPKEMIERNPKLEKWKDGQPGGPTNPLGARAIYLTTGGVDYGYRVHGTPEWKSIGRNASSGCFRMINQDVIDLYERVQGGEKVIVLTASGEMPKGLNIQTPPKPKKTTPKPEAKPAVAADTTETATTPTTTAPAVGTVTPLGDTTGTTTPLSTTPSATTVAPSTVVPATPAPAVTPITPVAPVTPVTPVAPVAPVEPVAPLTTAPVVTTPAAPVVTTPAAPVTTTPAEPDCAVSLVAGRCPV